MLRFGGLRFGLLVCNMDLWVCLRLGVWCVLTVRVLVWKWLVWCLVCALFGACGVSLWLDGVAGSGGLVGGVWWFSFCGFAECGW